MNASRRHASFPALPAGGAIVLFLFTACDIQEDEEREGSRAPAVQVSTEGKLSVLTLSEKQEKSLAIRIEAAEKRAIPRCLDLTGWVEARPGASAEIRSPVGGHLETSASWPHPGKRVEKGEVLES